jgi:uncharacterized protein
MVEFEFDPKKSAKNKTERGINFEEAREFWNLVAFVVSSDRGEEKRFARIVRRLDGRYWTSIYTIRGEKIRIISVRRSHEQEIKAYDRNVDR